MRLIRQLITPSYDPAKTEYRDAPAYVVLDPDHLIGHVGTEHLIVAPDEPGSPGSPFLAALAESKIAALANRVEQQAKIISGKNEQIDSANQLNRELQDQVDNQARTIREQAFDSRELRRKLERARVNARAIRRHLDRIDPPAPPSPPRMVSEYGDAGTINAQLPDDDPGF